MRFCFDTYDLNDDGYISREEMLLLLKDCMYKNSRETNEEDGDDGVKDLIEMTMRKMDQDRDGRVSYSDFWETVQEVRCVGVQKDSSKCFIGAVVDGGFWKLPSHEQNR